MSKLEKLIQQYCPDGVEWKTLYSITKQFSGMTGVSNKWAEEGNCVFIDYNNVYNHTSVDTTALKKATVKSLKQNTLKKGDILFTSASETPDECALSSVIEKDLPDGVFLDDHLFGLRLLDEYSSVISPSYLKYAFRSEQFRFQIRKVVRGATRHYVSKVDFMKIEIPVPPLPVQEEIVRILDAFTELQAELQAELQKRKQQYSYYRDNLLTNFTPEQAPKEYTLGEVTVDIYSGATPSKEKREYWVNGTIPWMSSGEVNLGQVYEVEGRITQLGYDKCSTKMVPEGSVVIALAGQGKTRGTVAILRTSVCTNQSLAALVPQKEIVSGEYLYYYLKTQYAKLREVSAGDGTRGGLNLKMLRAYKVVIPSHKAQDQIVAILDRFDTLTNDLTSGLPAEMEKRRQQYEFYRDKLLTFKRKEA